METKNTHKFLNLNGKLSELKVICAQKRKKPVIQFENPDNPDVSLLVVGWKKIGMLTELIGINVRSMRAMVLNEQVEALNKTIKKAPDKDIQIFANEFNGNFYIFNFATDKYRLVTFTEIRNVIKSKIDDIEESKFNNSKVWEKKFNSFEYINNQFDVMLRITSGRNTKDSAIKVIIYIRIKECNNSIQACTYTPIKRTENWKERLIKNINEAQKIIPTIVETIKNNMIKSITIEEAYNYINNIKFDIKDENKIEDIKHVLKMRFDIEFKTNKNKFSLSQALSFLGTHGVNTTERTLEILREHSYLILQ